MRSGPVRAFARVTFGNWLSRAYLGSAAFLLLMGAGDGGDQVAGVFALMLAVPTGALLLPVLHALGAWAQTGGSVWAVLVFSYVFQAWLLGLLVHAVRRGSRPAGL
ncbi:SCO4225 family membrane protein [Streptomyces yangpuensis]|uniref:SCO4225 family membrane protein n=1 Tax=Streptomyces yangpuensis TaxID=1648182 RepID=UPI003646F1E1